MTDKRSAQEVGEVLVPRGFNKWIKALRNAWCSTEWVDICTYGESVGYQKAAALNAALGLPNAPEGFRWEFGTRLEVGQSVLVARCVPV